MDVMTAEITTQRRNQHDIEHRNNPSRSRNSGAEKHKKKASFGARRAHVAPKKGELGKNANPAKKAPKAKRGAKSKESADARDSSKTDTILDVLKRPAGSLELPAPSFEQIVSYSSRARIAGDHGRRWKSDASSDRSTRAVRKLGKHRPTREELQKAGP